MRPLAPPDLSTAARMLLILPETARRAGMARLLAEAEAADRYRKRLGRAHPFWGNGSLEGAARARDIAPPQSLADGSYLACLSLALAALVAHRSAHGE